MKCLLSILFDPRYQAMSTHRSAQDAYEYICVCIRLFPVQICWTFCIKCHFDGRETNTIWLENIWSEHKMYLITSSSWIPMKNVNTFIGLLEALTCFVHSGFCVCIRLRMLSITQRTFEFSFAFRKGEHNRKCSLSMHHRRPDSEKAIQEQAQCLPMCLWCNKSDALLMQFRLLCIIFAKRNAEELVYTHVDHIIFHWQKDTNQRDGIQFSVFAVG